MPFSTATILNGLVLGWSVAWPPGPVNAELMRRSATPPPGMGFWYAYKVALGAACGDFLWALGVAMGAGAVINTPAIRVSLGVISFVLLLVLAAVFARNAWRIAHAQRQCSGAHAQRQCSGAPAQRQCSGACVKHRTDGDDSEQALGTSASTLGRPRDRGFLLGFVFVLTSPWGMGFWLAVIGSQATTISGSFANSLVLAICVVAGALAFATMLCVGVRLGARFFSRPAWQIATQGLTALLMLYFAARLALQLTS
jgi:threonine/homoserine/homoserine lactone efflux protein